MKIVVTVKQVPEADKVKVNPESAEAFYYIGLCHEKEGRADQALEAFQTALRFDPDHAKAREKVQPLE